MWPLKKPAPVIAPATPIAESLPYLRQLTDALPDAAMIVDARGLVLAANGLASDLLDARTEGQHISAVIRAPAILNAWQAVVVSGKRQHASFELRVPVPRMIEVHVSPLTPHVILVLKDLTREQSLERLRADFVANASHELRTPLASVLGFIETIEGAAKTDPKAQAKFLALMKSQAQRMKRLIDDLLSLSRIEMNEHVRPDMEVDLALVTRQVADQLRPLAKQEACDIRLNLSGAMTINGDRDELVQVVQNLMENAIKYGAAGKHIEVGGRRDGDHVELTVTDHGPGIAAEHIPRLTERFYRVSAKESRQKGGTGLGLAIVKHIVSRHRGRLSISSQLDRGSSFTMRFPSAKTKP